jgi:hypothetical protein
MERKYTRVRECVLGKTKYIVTTHFNPNAKETAEDILIRVVSNRIKAEINSNKPSNI